MNKRQGGGVLMSELWSFAQTSKKKTLLLMAFLDHKANRTRISYPYLTMIDVCLEHISKQGGTR